jgi:hypothetical protein
MLLEAPQYVLLGSQFFDASNFWISKNNQQK